MSLIETPPEDRFPIQTYVVEHNESLIRDAILRNCPEADRSTMSIIESSLSMMKHRF